MRMGGDRPSRRLVVSIGLDALVVLAFVLWVAMLVTGGFELLVLGFPVSAHHTARAAEALVDVVTIRLLFFTLGGRRRRLRDLARLYRPSSEPAPGQLPLLAGHTLWAGLGLCAFAALLLHRQLAAMYSVPDLGDPLLSIWRMGWLHHWLQGDPRPLFSPNIFYPEPLTFTYSDSMLLPGLVGSGLMALGFHPVVAYNLLFVSGFVISGVAMYLLAVRLTGSPRAAFVSAVLFGFYPFRFEHYSHLELQWTMWMPLGLLALHAFLRTQRLKYALLASLCGVAQLYSSMYFAVFFCLYVIPVLGLLAVLKRPPLRRLWPGALAGAALAAILAIPLAKPYLAAQARKGDRDIGAILSYSATLKDYVSPHARSIAYDGVLPHSEPERALFPGFVAPTLAVIALWPPLGPVRVAYAAGMLLAFEASRGFHGFIYPHLYEWFAPIRGMRVPARFSLLVGMTLALLAAFGGIRLLARCRTPAGANGLFVLLLALMVFDLRAKLDLLPVWKDPPAIYAAVAHRPNVVLAEFPWWSDLPGVGAQFPLMYFSLWHWANMVNGTSGFEPPDYHSFIESIHRFPESAAIDALEARGVTHVTVNCALYGPDRDCHGVLAALDASPRFRAVSKAHWEGDTVALYELLN